MTVTELSPTKIDTALKLLARMIARAYLKDTRIPPAKFTDEQLPHFGNALTSHEEKLKQRRAL
jgi:hypothetical protein